MGALVSKTFNTAKTLMIKEYEDGSNPHTFHYLFYCPGCDGLNFFKVGGTRPPTWTFDGNLESPTFHPSLRYLGGETGTLCHLYLRAGVLEFQADCPHAMNGKKAALEPIPESLQEY